MIIYQRGDYESTTLPLSDKGLGRYGGIVDYQFIISLSLGGWDESHPFLLHTEYMKTLRKGLRGYTTLKEQKNYLYISIPRCGSAGKQRVLSTGLIATESNIKKAIKLQGVIDGDIDRNDFDTSLDRYLPHHKRAENKRDLLEKLSGHERSIEIITPSSVPTSIPLSELYREYTQYRMPHTSPSTHKSAYAVNQSRFDECPVQDFTKAREVSQWLHGKFTEDSSRRSLVQIGASVMWGIGSGLLPDDTKNPYPALIHSLYKSNKDKEIKYYSLEERTLIIEKAYEFCTYLPYAQLLELLFLVGLRWSEAIALEVGDWVGDWEKEQGHLCISKSVVTGLLGLELKEGLKNQDKRCIPVVPRAKELLNNIVDSKWGENRALLFPSPKSHGYLTLKNYSARFWIPLLESIASEVPSFPVYTLYSARRTFISLALKSGYAVEDVAYISGNSPGIIYSNYAGHTKKLTLKDFS